MAAALGPLASVIKDLPPNGLGMLYREDPYEASRLLAHDEWRPVAERFGGELLVAAPARDLILYVDGRPPLARTTLAAVAADVYGKADRPLSPAVLRWTATGWVVAP